MKAFIDTSSLIKKYITEKGSKEFDDLLEELSEIIVSPICFLELSSAIQHRIREKTLTQEQAAWLQTEAQKDLYYFSQVIWNENLEQKAVEMIRKHHLKTLDSLQLASAILSKADRFITSDKSLESTAKKEITHVLFI